MTLVRRLVEMHQGKVQALSEGPGLGSEFVVRLPALAGGGPVRTPTNGARNERCPSPSCRVLVVDDNLDAAESLSMLLQIAGHEVRLAHDGPGALDAAAEFQPEEPSPAPVPAGAAQPSPDGAQPPASGPA